MAIGVRSFFSYLAVLLVYGIADGESTRVLQMTSNCSAGTAMNNSTRRCVECLPGWASSMGRNCMNVGVTCAPGSGILMGVSGGVCQPCPGGHFCTNGRCLSLGIQDNTMGCNRCPTARGASAAGAVLCTRESSTIFQPVCPPGSGLVPFLRGCYRCNGTTFQNGRMLRCQPCPQGLVANAMQSGCIVAPCDAGFYRPVNLVNSSCLQCPRGSASPPGSIGISSCLPSAICGPGQAPRVFSLISGRYGQNRSDCLPCQVGRFCETGRCLRVDDRGLDWGLEIGCPRCPKPSGSSLPGAVQCSNTVSIRRSRCPPGTGRLQSVVTTLGCYNCKYLHYFYRKKREPYSLFRFFPYFTRY